MIDQDAKENLFYNVISSLDIESQNQNSDLESPDETRQNLPFLQAQRVQNEHQTTSQNILQMLPPKVAFTTTAKAFLQYSKEFPCRNQYLF